MPSRRIDGSFILNAGGAGLAIFPETSFEFPEYNDAYNQFLMSDASGSPRVEIRLNVNKCPDTGSMEVVFDADGAWSLRRDSAGSYFVGHGPASLDAPPWVIKFDESFGSAVVYANPEITGELGLPVCPVHYPVDQLLFVNALASNGGVLIHCAGIELGGRVYLFPGRSGAGKSTLSRLFVTGGRGRVLSDDRMILRKTAGGFSAYGTPWPGDAGYAVNEGAELGGIFFLRHGERNAVSGVSAAEAVERLLQVTSVPWYDQVRSLAVTDTIGALVGGVECAVLDFLPDEGLAEFVMQVIEGREGA